MTETAAPPRSTQEQRQEFYDRIERLSLAPLWEVLKKIMPAQPTSAAVPAIWRYQELRPYLLESGGLLTAEEAERRVLAMVNPGYPGELRTTTTLYAGIQLILPGETAPAHRHTPSALRFMIEGTGAFTAVGGERTTMREGDMVITPAWAWHDHGHEGDAPVAWLDGLDIPMIRYFEAVFNEGHNAAHQQITRPEGDAEARYGSGLAPLQGGSPYGLTSPIFNYPYERSRAALLTVAANSDPDPHTAHTLRYTNPLDGGWAMPTLATWLTRLEKGQKTTPIRSTDSQVLHVVEGRGTVTIGDQSFDVAPKDTLAVPGWAWRQLSASEDMILFAFSDRVVHEKLGFWREERR